MLRAGPDTNLTIARLLKNVLPQGNLARFIVYAHVIIVETSEACARGEERRWFQDGLASAVASSAHTGLRALFDGVCVPGAPVQRRRFAHLDRSPGHVTRKGNLDY